MDNGVGLNKNINTRSAKANFLKSCAAYASILLLVLNFSCLSVEDTPDRIPGIPEKSIIFTCEGNYFVRTLSGGLYNSFFIGDSNVSFFSLWQNHLYKHDLKSMLVLSDRIFAPEEVSQSYYTNRDNLTGWLLTQNKGDGKWTAHILDTLGKSISTMLIEPDKNDNNGYVIASAPDHGFVLVVNPGSVNPDKYTVHRYSNAGVLVWKKVLTNPGKITSVVSLRGGGFLVGGTNFLGSIRNSFVAKLDNNGNEKWQQIKHAGNLNTSFSMDYLLESDSSDYLMLLNTGSSISVLRTDTAYTIKWSRPIDNKSQFTSPGMMQVKKEILIFYGGGNNLPGTYNIGFSNVSTMGTINWSKVYGGTGDETVFSLRHLPTIGYYLIGRTDNWDGKNADPVTNGYLIKTDLNGNSCR